MKIAMIGQKGMPARFGGVERHVEGLATELVQHGFDITVYARRWYTPKEVRSVHGVNIVHLPTVHTKHLDAIVHTFLATIHAMANRFDVVHYHGVGPSLLSWIPRIFTPHIRVITTFHSIDRKHKKWGVFARCALRIGEWSACRFAHETMAVSQTIRQYARDLYDRDARYVPNALSPMKKSTQTDTLAQWGVEPGSYMLMVSRLVPHKGFHYAIEAWKRATADSASPLKNKKLVIVGDGYYTDTYVRELRKLAQGREDIVFTGSQSGEPLVQLYSHAFGFVHPSENEGLPMVVLEAMSYGLSIFLSDIQEHRDVILKETRFFPAGSVEAIEKAFCVLAQLSPEERATEGAAHRRMIQERYEWSKVLASIVEVYTPPVQSVPEG